MPDNFTYSLPLEFFTPLKPLYSYVMPKYGLLATEEDEPRSLREDKSIVLPIQWFREKENLTQYCKCLNKMR